MAAKTTVKKASETTAKTTTKTTAKTTAKPAPKAAAKPASKATAKPASKKHHDRVFISEADQYLFGQGIHYEIYKKLGAHLSCEDGVEGVHFAVWAPNASAVHVIGDFNNWSENVSPMNKLGSGGIWATFVPDAKEGDLYKFLIFTPSGERLYKSDPYGNSQELRPGTASRIVELDRFCWDDKEWMEARRKKDYNHEPVAIYECHIGSWMRHPKPEAEGFYNYRLFADKITEYLKEMKYTHIELMGIAEYPFDGSWGYQVTGYYAPTSRYGSPEDFMYLVNKLHRNGIGVILDWVPAHFATDDHGLGRFDGQCIYEHPDPRKGEHPDWGTKIFNYEKTEVRNFLIANVLFWIRQFHVDGIRVDAVASMLYLDYGKKDGQWCPNRYGGHENLDAIEFFKHMNSIVHGTYPGFLTIAEESTAWPKITGDVNDDGLGFSFKWNMGWMHDFCEYMKLDPVFRRDHHYAMTFAMSYNESENYILPLSHDEVVHLKCSMLEKMPGYEVDKFANLRCGYTYMFGHAGKKLLFMGQDFAQEREWSEERELDWNLLVEPLNRGMYDYVRELLNIYRKYPCMYEFDNCWDGFEWLNCDDKDRSTYSFIRKSSDGKHTLAFIINMTPMLWEDYKLGVPTDKKLKLLLNSDETRFGGKGSKVKATLTPVEEQCDYKDHAVTLNIPAYTALIYIY
ncbi:MAG: 1,4-alpha-glucan branching protein GlgB [Lachnospiraceae bacterium]|nr:1,4-alpha-glucan branching protein GlgB [Lachnospiraceae bacterium]